MATTITKDMVIGEIIHIDKGFVPLLMGMGMHCLGCPSSQNETIEEAYMYTAKMQIHLQLSLMHFLQNKVNNNL